LSAQKSRKRRVGKRRAGGAMLFWTPDKKKTASTKEQMNIELETGPTAAASLCAIQNR